MRYVLFVSLLGLWCGLAAAEEEPATVRHVQRGDRFIAQGRLDLAIEEYEKALAAGAGSASFLNRLGGMYLETRALGKAVRVLQRSLLEKPGQIPVYARIAEAFGAAGRPDSAIFYMERARTVAPRSSAVHGRLGAHYLQAGLLDPARAHLDTALQLDARNPEAHRFLGLYYTQRDSLHLAMDRYRRVLQILPRDAEAYSSVALLHALEEDFGASLAAYERAKEFARDPLETHAINVKSEAVRAIRDGKMRARYILVKTPAEGRDLLQRLERGEDFGALAQAHSLAPNAEDGGDLGFFGPGELYEPFEKVVLQLEVGDVSGILEVPMGVVIIQRLN